MDRKKKKQPELQDEPAELWLDEDDTSDPEGGDELAGLDWLLPQRNSKRIATRRAIEARLDELILRQSLEDYPDFRVLD